MFINGHIYPAADNRDWGTSYAQRTLLFHNIRDGQFEEVPPVTGSGLATLISGRGAAFGDLFNNGRIDVIISPVDGPPLLLKNVNPDHHHWVELKLVGGLRSPSRRSGRDCLPDGKRHAPAPGCAERRKLRLDKRSAPALRPGRRNRCRNRRDSLALRRQGDHQAPGRGSHLHYHRGQGNYRGAVLRATLPRCHSGCC